MMPRIKKQLIQMLSALSPAEIAKLVAPKLRVLRRERRAILKRLREIERQLAGLAPGLRGLKPGGRVRRRRRRRIVRAVAALRPIAPGPVRRARRGTMAAQVMSILANAGQPMRMRDIRNGLVGRGVPARKGLLNYLSRVLNTNAAFEKVGRGMYGLAAAPGRPARAGRRKKSAPATA